VVSHDREFLNNVATDIIYLNSQLLEPYKGNYEMFVKTRAERLKNQQREYEAQKQYRDHIQVSCQYICHYILSYLVLLKAIILSWIRYYSFSKQY